MADQKLTALTENTTPAGTDLLYIVDDPAGTPLSQKITISNLLSLASIDIGDTIGGTPADGGILYADSSDALRANHWATGATSYASGAVTGIKLEQQVIADAPRFEVLNLSGVGQPNAFALATSTDPFSFFLTDTDTLTTYTAFTINPGTPASSSITFGLTAGTSSNPEFALNTVGLALRVPIDMNSNKITELATPTASTDAATKAYADGVIPDQTGNSGKYLTTNGTATSWGTVVSSPGGSDTQVQFNDSSAFGGDAGMTYNKTTDVLTLTSGVRIGSGSSNYLGDSGGNGSIYFGRNGNDADLYGYTDIRFYTSASSNPFIQFSPSRLDYNPSNSLDFSPISGGQGDNSVGLMPNNIATYLGVGAGVYISGGVTATANNDFMVGTYFRARFTPGAYTGLTGIGVLFDVPSSDYEVLRFITRASNDDIIEITKQAKVTTTDGTQTTLATITIPTTTTVQVEATVVARRTGGSAGTAEDGAGYRMMATIKNVAGTATLIGAVTANHTAEDQAGWDATIDVTGATARIRVTGATNNNVSWVATYRIHQIGT